MPSRNRGLISKREIDERFAYQVEIIVPETGLGERLTTIEGCSQAEGLAACSPERVSYRGAGRGQVVLCGDDPRLGVPS